MASVLASSPAAAEELRRYLDGFMGEVVEAISGLAQRRGLAEARSRAGGSRPFHEALLPPQVLASHDFERRFAAALGVTFEHCAERLALGAGGQAQRAFRLAGPVAPAVSQRIEELLAGLVAGSYRGRHRAVAAEIAQAAAGRPAPQRRVVIDLRILTARGHELLFELKSPKPNKGQCLEVTQRLLLCHAIRGKAFPEYQTFYAMAYNPSGGSRASYAHSPALE
jgi:hypothetical protein